MKKGIHFLWMLNHKEDILILEIFQKKVYKSVFILYTKTIEESVLLLS